MNKYLKELKFNNNIPQKYDMNPKETLAYHCCIIYEHFSIMIFPKYRHSKMPSKGDPRKCTLFKHCYKMNALLEGKLEKIYYPLFIKAQFDIFKKIFEATKQCPLITPTIISSNKALSRWNVWKYYYEKVKSIKNENNTVNVEQSVLENEFKSTLDFMNCNSYIFDDINCFIENEKDIYKFTLLKKISPYYISLSPWISKLKSKDDIYNISNAETILEILSDKDKQLHKKYFSKEYI